jgi:hypothetical protein
MYVFFSLRIKTHCLNNSTTLGPPLDSSMISCLFEKRFMKRLNYAGAAQVKVNSFFLHVPLILIEKMDSNSSSLLFISFLSSISSIFTWIFQVLSLISRPYSHAWIFGGKIVRSFKLILVLGGHDSEIMSFNSWEVQGLRLSRRYFAVLNFLRPKRINKHHAVHLVHLISPGISRECERVEH